MKSPVKYYGGKGTMLKQILAAFPASGFEKYYEGYGGSGVVLLNKPQVAIEVFNDLHTGLFNLFLTLQSPESFAEFRLRAELAHYSEAIWQWCHELLESEQGTRVDRAFAFWYISRSSFNGMGGFAHATTVVRKEMSKSARDYLAGVEGLAAFHSRWQKVLVMNRDALPLAKRLDRPGWMYYLDPPYVWDTRKSSQRYAVDQPTEHHQELVQIMLGIQHAKVLISGYDHEIYNPLLEAGWTRVSFKSPYVDSIETLWANYSDFVDAGEFA